MHAETMTIPRTRQGVRNLDEVGRRLLPVSGPSGQTGAVVNVGDTERWLSAAGGGLLLVYGLTRGSLAGLGLAALGGMLLERGLTGHCALYSALGRNTAGRTYTEAGPETVYPVP